MWWSLCTWLLCHVNKYHWQKLSEFSCLSAFRERYRQVKPPIIKSVVTDFLQSTFFRVWQLLRSPVVIIYPFFNSIVTSLSIWTTAMGERIWTRSTARKLQSIRHPNVMLRFSLPKFFRYAMSTHCNLRFFCIQNVAYRKSEGKRLSIFHTYCSS